MQQLDSIFFEKLCKKIEANILVDALYTDGKINKISHNL